MSQIALWYIGIWKNAYNRHVQATSNVNMKKTTKDEE